MSTLLNHQVPWGHLLNQRRGQMSPHGDDVCGGGGLSVLN